jgi:hypothetical protein
MKTTSDQELLNSLKALEGHILTPSERWRQKVSWVMGTVDEKNSMTRPQVQELLERQSGLEPA